jgi:hypothetical protein
MSMSALASVQPVQSVPISTSPQVPARAVRHRPASKIDDAVRRRAYESVARSLES